MSAKTYGYSTLSDIVKTGRPLLMLDRVQIDAAAVKGTGIKAVSVNEPYFPGHFPESPIMPGVLQLAGMTQVAEACLRIKGLLDLDADLKITRVKRYKFRNPALPGDLLSISVELTTEEDGVYTFKGLVSCEGKTVSQGEFSVAAATGIPQRDFSTALCPQFCLSEEEQTADGREECAEIMKHIPHRFPFLLVDRQLCYDKENCTNVVVKNVSGGEAFFDALRRPVLPEYLQAEIAAQACCALAFEMPEAKGKLAYYMSIDKAEFIDEVMAGDQLLIRVKGSVRGKLGTCSSQLFIGEKQVASLSVKFVLVDKE